MSCVFVEILSLILISKLFTVELGFKRNFGHPFFGSYSQVFSYFDGDYRTRAINHRGHYSKKNFWPIGCGYYSREATIQKKKFRAISGQYYETLKFPVH